MKKLLVMIIFIVGIFFTSCGGVLDISSFPGYPGIESFTSINDALTWYRTNCFATIEGSHPKSLSGTEVVVNGELVTIQLVDNAIIVNGILYTGE